jgi:hypothetical protein
MDSKLTKKARSSNIWHKVSAFTFIPDTYVKNTSGFTEGKFYDFWINDPNRAQDVEDREVIRRTKDRDAFLKSIDYKPADIYKRRTLPGVAEDHSVAEILGMYGASQNPQSHAAAFYGNKLQGTMDRWIGTLSDDEKAIADWIIEDFSGDNYNRLSTAFTADTNNNLGLVDRYFPIRKKGVNKNAENDEYAVQLMDRAGIVASTPDKKFTKTRLINIPPEFQDPIELDIMGLWQDQIVKQEHYISIFQWTKDAKYLMEQTGLAESIVAKHGTTTRDWYNLHRGVIANPNIYKAYSTGDRVVQTLRTNFGVAALTFNLSTVLKQGPSVVYYLADAGGATTGSFNLMKASTQFNTPKRIKSQYNFIRSMDPQWESRVMNRLMQDIKSISESNVLSRGKKKLATAGMFLIGEVDIAATAVGWTAVYNHNKDLGFTDEEAAFKAKKATLRTQPASRAKDIPQFLQNKGGLSLFTMFSNQTNKIFNIIAGDIAPSIKRIASRKTPNAVKKELVRNTIANTTAVTMGAIGISIIGGWQVPDDDEEVLAAAGLELIKQLAGTLAIVSSDVQAGLTGYSSGVSIFPIATDMTRNIKNMAMGKEITPRQVEHTLTSMGTVFGFPGTIAAGRVKNVIDVTIEEDNFAEGILELFGPTFREGSIARELPGIIEEKVEDITQ